MHRHIAPTPGAKDPNTRLESGGTRSGDARLSPETRGPSAARRTHRKSRLGCKNCKRRKIKVSALPLHLHRLSYDARPQINPGLTDCAYGLSSAMRQDLDVGNALGTILTATISNALLCPVGPRTAARPSAQRRQLSRAIVVRSHPLAMSLPQRPPTQPRPIRSRAQAQQQPFLHLHHSGARQLLSPPRPRSRTSFPSTC